MFRSLTVVILASFLLAGCSGKGESELSKALSGAVNEQKISRKKMDSILQEYDRLIDEDRAKARKYVLEVVNAIDMGADSTHIDVVRKQVVGTKSPRIKS